MDASTNFDYSGTSYTVHSAYLDRSIQTSTRESNLLRHELREGDEWFFDEGRIPAKDRCELNNYALTFSDELWVSFALRGWGMANASSLLQIFSDEVEFQLQSSATGLAFITFLPDGLGGNNNTVRHTAGRLIDGRPDHIVLRIKPRATGTSELQAWRNGVQLFNLSGFSMGTDSPSSPKRLKRGLYRDKVAATSTMQVANFTASTSNLLSKVANPDPLPRDWR